MDLGGSGHARAVGAAVDGAVRLYPMADDPDPAVLAGRGESVDRALEAVEHVRLVTRPLYPKRLVVPVADLLPSPPLPRPACGVSPVR